MSNFDLLMPLVKRKLRIAVGDAEDDARICDLMAVAGQELSDMLGLPPGFDFSKPSSEQALYLNYCFYSYSDAEDEFETNYLGTIERLREKWMAVDDAQDNQGE